MSSLATVDSRLAIPQGHTFEQNVITGGTVHLGDTYYITNEQNSGRPRTPWRPRSDEGHRQPGESTTPEQLYVVPRCSTAYFTGRSEQLKQIRQFLTAPVNTNGEYRHRIVVLRGLGGSGKSQVCLRYAEVNREAYWGVFWIDASSRSTAEAGYAYLGQQAGFGPTWTAGKYWLSQCARSWLLILDNADDPDMDISEYFPSGRSGHILITTRIRDLEIYATAGHSEFGRMEPEEAIELLLRAAYAGATAHSYDSEQTAAAKGIANALGYLAIALNHAGATIRRKIYTIEDYLNLYLGDRHRLLNSRKISPDEINVITTWEIPFKRIEDQRSVEYQDAVVLMCIFAFLHFDAIPEALFAEFWESPDQNLLHFEALPDLLKSGSKLRYRRAITILSEYSLINVDSNNQTCSLHPVVHQWAKSRINSDDKMVEWLKCTMHLLSRCNADDFTAARGMSIIPHIDYCLEVTSNQAPAILETHRAMGQLERFAAMFAANGIWRKALPILEKVAAFRLRTQGWWHEDTLSTQRSVAHCLWNLFQVEAALKVQLEIRNARWYLRPSPKDWIHFLLPDHVDYCLALDDLTQSLWLAGLIKYSLRTGKRSVLGLSKRLGYEDPRTWNAMFNFGRTRRHAGELESAHQLLSFVTRKRKVHLGPDHPDTLMARNELGMSFWSLGKNFAIAERIVTSVRDARSRVLGRDHAYTLWSCNDLSKIMCSRGRPSDAVRLLEGIVPIVEATLGRDHVGMHMTKGNLAHAYALCKDWIKAEGVLVQMLEVVDETHRDWFDFMYGYVRVQSELGQYELARRACDKLRQRFSAEKEDSLRFRSITELVASVYYREAKFDELNTLKAQYPWINDANVMNPPVPTKLAHVT